MNNYLPLLQTTTLFAGLSAAELSTLLKPLCWRGNPAAG